MDVSFSGILTYIEELVSGKKNKTKKQRQDSASKALIENVGVGADGLPYSQADLCYSL